MDVGTVDLLPERSKLLKDSLLPKLSELLKKSLLPKLSELLKDEYKLQKRDVACLSLELLGVQAALRNEAEVLGKQHDEQVRFWAGIVRELSEGILKYVDTILARNEGKELTKKMAILFRKRTSRYQISQKIEDIKKLASEVSESCDSYRVIDVASNTVSLTVDPRLSAVYIEGEEEIIGMEDAREKLIKILCKGDQKLTVLSVVGFGGLGKTTLANAVYDTLKMQFDCGAFVPVSQNPDMEKVFMDILLQIDKQKYWNYAAENENQLIQEIRKFLQNKRYLIVIDDLWDEKLWDTISLSLPTDDCGSRVITTTRNNEIAERCCSECKDLIYEIMPLGYQNSKKLFLKSCFGSEDSCHDALTEVDEILKICDGMPLAILSIASAIVQLLARKIKEPWQEMMKSLHSARRDLHCVEELTRILAYSYFDLPNTLRACLLYLAASAKNQRVQRDNLVLKWIAEGLIPEDKNCSHGEVASRYFDELVNRNLIHPVKYVNCLGKETYEVPYLMLYILRLISREENFATFLSDSEPHVNAMPIRLFMQCSDSEHSIGTERVNLTNACSVTMLGPAMSVSLKHLECVRVLDLNGCKDLDNSAMDDICKMILLKYLSLKRTQLTEIPPQISDLRYLETLAIRYAQITTLPPQIGELQNLEILDVRQTQISNLPQEIRKLQNLVTLDLRKTQVKELPNEVLQLPKLVHLYFGQSGSPGGVNCPVGSDQLKSVKVMGTVDSRECSGSAMKEISELIELRELKVVLYDGPDDKQQSDKLLSFIGKCRNLVSLTVYGDSNTSDKLNAESPNFPRLEKLKVAGRFVKVPRWIADLNTLTLLVIRVCKLEDNDLGIIGGLPCLSVLALSLVALPRKQVTVTSSAGFGSLVVFCFDCRIPWLTFQDKAMPKLEHLQLKLYAGPAGKCPSDIKHLENLKMVILLYSSQYEASVRSTGTVDAMKKDAASHANLIELSINGVREIFPSNENSDSRDPEAEISTSVNGVTTEAEIEEVPASV